MLQYLQSRYRSFSLSVGLLIPILLAFAFPFTAQAQENGGGGIDATIESYFEPIATFVSDIIFYSVPLAGTELPLILVWLIGAAIFFTFYYKFLNVRAFNHALDLVRGKYDNPDATGEVNHFQALTTALSGTVGLGNIAGVAVAISLGGPGATLWMVLAGFFGMSTKFVECTLGVMYRHENEDGSVSGGPMYYLTEGLGEKGFGWLGRGLAVAFAVFCIGGALGGGNMFQVNQAYQQVLNISGGESSFFADKAWLFGLAIAILLGIVIIGGIKSIAKVTEKIVPIMGVIYLLAGLVIIVLNWNRVPAAFSTIFVTAFAPEAVAGGFVGVLIQGFRRAAFSNEAGLGSSAIAHSAVKTDEPITEGLVALHEPLVDTIIVCTMTALVIVITGAYETMGEGISGIQLTSAAFEQSSISWFTYVLAVAVILFAFSTLISWSYYGLKCWTYLVGEGWVRESIFKLFYCLVAIVGAVMSLDSVIGFSDSMIFAMSVPNVIGLYIMAPTVRDALASYWSRLRRGDFDERRRRAEAS